MRDMLSLERRVSAPGGRRHQRHDGIKLVLRMEGGGIMRDKLYTTQEVADMLHVSVAKIRDLVHKKKLHVTHVGDCWRFSDEQIAAYLRGASE